MAAVGESRSRILVVDDDVTLRERLARALRERGWSVTTAWDRASARAAASSGVDAALVDVHLCGESGFTVVTDLRAIAPSARIFLTSGAATDAVRAEAKRVAASFLQKPFDVDDLIVLLQRGTEGAESK